MDKKIMTVIAVVAVAVVVVAAAAVVLMGDKNKDNATEYDFYLYFADNDAKNGWYSAQGSDAGDAFQKAMKAANFEYTVSNWGYVQSIAGVDNGSGWYCAQYLYSKTDADAAAGSISYATYNYGAMSYSNGWKSTSGYDSSAFTFKLGEFNSTIYFLIPYNSDYSASGPDEISGWKTTGPFA